MKPRDWAYQLRGLVTRAVVRATNDAGETQTADARIYSGVDRTKIEIMQPFGLASRPRPGGAMVVFAVQGDQGDLVGAPIADPADRFGGLEEGEAALYGADGSRVHVRADGSMHVTARTRILSEVEGMRAEMTAESLVTTIEETRVKISAEGVTLEVAGVRMVLSAAGLAITGGTVTHDGRNIGSTHVHGEVTPGPADTGIPSN